MRPSTFKTCATLIIRNSSFSYCQARWLHTNGFYQTMSGVTAKNSNVPSFIKIQFNSKERKRNYSVVCCSCNTVTSVSNPRYPPPKMYYDGWMTSDSFRHGALGYRLFSSYCDERANVSSSFKNDSNEEQEIQSHFEQGKEDQNDVLFSSETDNDFLTVPENYEVSVQNPQSLPEATVAQEDNEVNVPDRQSLPDMSQTVFNLAPYVQKSITLQKLIKLEVNLSKVEQVGGMANLLLMSDFDKDILPYLHHLLRVGVMPDKLGYILSNNPLLLTEYIEHLEQRVGYLLSKNFTLQEVADLYTRAPVIVLMNPEQLDTKLAFFQQNFNLSGRQVRQVVMTRPQILPWKREKIAEVRSNLDQIMGFEKEELKLMLIREPKVYMTDVEKIQMVFDYVHNRMGISHSLIARWPNILKCHPYLPKYRHLFLLSLGRAQYDPRKENFVSMKRFAQCTEQEFCETVAKSSVEKFNNFLKTL